MTKKEFKIGAEVFVVNPKLFPEPTQGTIAAITKAPGKTIGVVFDKPIGRNALDGRCAHPYGVWCQVSQVLNKKEVAALRKRLEIARKKSEIESTSYDSLTLDLDPSTSKTRAAFN